MAASFVADLRLLGAPVDDPVATARFVGGQILNRRQKAAVLRGYLSETGRPLTDAIRAAADQYAEFL